MQCYSMASLPVSVRFDYQTNGTVGQVEERKKFDSSSGSVLAGASEEGDRSAQEREVLQEGREFFAA